jgi:hypothetical protein
MMVTPVMMRVNRRSVHDRRNSRNGKCHQQCEHKSPPLRHILLL